MSSAETISESALSEHLGLSRAEMAGVRARHLTEGVHWARDGKAVVYTTAGREKIGGILGANGKKDAEPVATVPLPAVAVVLTVKYLPRNARYVIATDGERDGLRVRVGDQKKFKAGMVLRAELIPDGADTTHFRLVGRLPRFPGRW
jgi:hypothetical protein